MLNMFTFEHTGNQVPYMDLLGLQKHRWAVTSKAREFVDFFVDNAVHEDDASQPRQGNLAVDQLVHRCLTMAETQGISRADIDAEFPDLTEHFRFIISIKNADARRKSSS